MDAGLAYKVHFIMYLQPALPNPNSFFYLSSCVVQAVKHQCDITECNSLPCSSENQTQAEQIGIL